MIGARPRRLPLALARTFSLLVGGAAALCAARAALRSVAYFAGPPRKVYLQEFSAQVRAVESRVPAGDFVLHLSAAPEVWFSRLWQRALYPRNQVVVVQPPWDPQRIGSLRAKYGARFAISAGDPPSDPGYVWRIDLGRIPGASGQTLFGEIGP